MRVVIIGGIVFLAWRVLRDSIFARIISSYRSKLVSGKTIVTKDRDYNTSKPLGVLEFFDFASIAWGEHKRNAKNGQIEVTQSQQHRWLMYRLRNEAYVPDEEELRYVKVARLCGMCLARKQ